MAELTHAGGIVIQIQGDSPRYLIVTAKNDFERWVFPKGKIDPGESPEAAAEREVLEESGVEARALESVGDTEFKKDGQESRAEYFLMQFLRNGGPGEDRKRRWCTYEEAQGLLSSDFSRDLLRQARVLVTKVLRFQGSAS